MKTMNQKLMTNQPPDEGATMLPPGAVDDEEKFTVDDLQALSSYGEYFMATPQLRTFAAPKKANDGDNNQRRDPGEGLYPPGVE